MKNFAIACAAVVLLAATASAAEPVAKSTLASMGLGGMQQMSDNDGMAVRGLGIPHPAFGGGTRASVWGSSTANWYLGQTSNNNYAAEASWLGKSSNAVGKSFSFAGKAYINAAADPTGFAIQANISGGFAGGGASAHAW
jgi:hypothetical protein